MAKTSCRIAILGLDHWYSALLFIPAFAAEPRIELAGIAHSDLKRAREVASQVGVNRVVADPAELIADPSIGAVAIFTSTDSTSRLCVAAARAGKHVVAIKPVARTLDEATDVLAAVRAAGIRLMPTECIGPGGRRGPVELVRRLVSDGRLGEVAFARCSISAGLPRSWPDDSSPGWFVDPAKCAGGGWIDHAVYEIDRLRWALGREVESVWGEVASARHTSLAVEDWGCALARFRGGVLAELRNDWFMPSTSMYQGQWEVAGTRGVVRVDEVSHRVGFAETPPQGGSLDTWVDLAVPANFDMRDVAAHVADVVMGRAEPLGGVEDAWSNLAFAEAFYEAAKTGAPVLVKEVPKP
ncbi:MAG: Gfo/Idh/MocA family oxidoreductase [Candidatus Limnocylindrales bacterium]|jgi:predicted dehydrogenase